MVRMYCRYGRLVLTVGRLTVSIDPWPGYWHTPGTLREAGAHATWVGPVCAEWSYTEPSARNRRNAVSRA